MAFIYLGFDTHAMLWFLKEFNESIVLTTTEIGEWEIKKINNGKVEFKATGSLTLCIAKAFKPHVNQARALRTSISRIFKC